MCGIAGILSPNPSCITSEKLNRMADALAHRGPDGEGFWINPTRQVGFAHRRLSIIDLSPQAAQPMHYLGRYTIVYNGEIYNYLELREALSAKGLQFHTDSDTEVILAAYHQYGSDCLQFFDGMFAFGIWDDEEKVFFAARDRFGEKPFHYFLDKNDQSFYFASEMKGLWSIGIAKSVDEQSMLYYLALGYTSMPIEKERTFYKNIYSLPPAHWMKKNCRNHSIVVQSYWDILKSNNNALSVDEASEKIRELLSVSVNRRMRSDVELGSSLSGGIDSSAVVATMNRLGASSYSHKSFSAIFPGFEKDESGYIDKITRQYKLEAYYVTPTGDDLVRDFEKLCYHHERPFDSAGVFAQYKVFDLAKNHSVKVLLDGQGADEVFAGYARYIHWWLQELFSKNQFSLLQKEKKHFRKNQVSFQWGIQNYFAAKFPGMAAMQLQKRTFAKLGKSNGIADEFVHAYSDLDYCYKPTVRELNDILYYNSTQFGLEELLVSADRNSMAHGREVRLPFLNHELVEFAFAMGSEMKMRDGFSKWILRESMKKELPAAITWRTDKIGFEPPQFQWMQNPQLQEMIRESKRNLIDAGILRKELLNNPVQPEAAYSASNYDWRYLVAGTLLTQ